MKKLNNIFAFIIFLIIPQIAGLIGSVFTAPAVGSTSLTTGPTWYAALIKPSFNPPAWVFAPVWTTLFLLMGIAAFLVWRKGMDPRVRKDDKIGDRDDKMGGGKRKEVKIALAIFIVQLALNTLWSILFFGLHSPDLALLEISVLWLAILVTILTFHKISRAAAWLLLPYILWVSFAAYLNYSLWQLNRFNTGHQIACTMEARLCPDGSFVGRVGPKCEFAPCP